MDPKGLRETQNEYFLISTHTKHLILVTFCDATARNGPSFRTHTRMDEQTDKRRDGRTIERTDEWTNEQTDEQMDGQTDMEIKIAIHKTPNP